MATPGHISEEQRTGRLISGAEINSLASAFSLTGDKPFTIFITSKTDATSVTTEILTVKLPGNDAAVPMPFRTEQWSELLITEISADDILTTYDVYWAAGEAETVTA